RCPDAQRPTSPSNRLINGGLKKLNTWRGLNSTVLGPVAGSSECTHDADSDSVAVLCAGRVVGLPVGPMAPPNRFFAEVGATTHARILSAALA
ncbi:MAG: hypothetical protein OEZ41_13685, partial [Nitrospirota bacterium]|nr:hypothetical protein [Nitrospirota bacterium]